MPQTLPLRIGTRGSPLALAQAREVRDRLAGAHPDLAHEDAVRIEVISTTGDQVQDRTLSEVGGKGLFTKEIDEALLDGRVRMAAHSMKDVPTWLPANTIIAAILPREDPRDAFIAREAADLASLPAGAVVGTASLRRRSQVLYRRPDLTVVPLRGNVGTRLGRLAEGRVDATLLAMAGLNRLGRADAVTAPMTPEEMLPAVAQGAIGLACREDDDRTRTLLAALDHGDSHRRVRAERAFLEVLDGSCRTPIAALATLDDDGMLRFRGLIARPDGSEVLDTTRHGNPADAEALGRDAGEELRRRAGPGFMEAKS